MESIDVAYRHFETGDPPRNGVNQDTYHEPDRIRTGRALSSDWDLVIAEGTAALQTLVAHKFLSNPRATTVFLAADETFYEVRDKPTRFLWYGLAPFTNTIDLCITISDLVTEWVRPFLPLVPRRVVHPTTTAEKYEELTALAPSSPDDPFRLLSVGDARAMKNYGALVSAVESVIDNRSQTVEVTILGEGHHNESYAAKPFVSTPGQVPAEEFPGYFERASAYVQPSRGDGFGVAALEGMLAGLPTVVTELVGAKQLLDGEWIVSATPDGLARSLESLMAAPAEDRCRLGKRNRREAVVLSPDAQAEAFADALESAE